MKSIFKITFIALLIILTSIGVKGQASLTIVNDSKRLMTVKVMSGYSGKGTLYEVVTIDANSSETISFSEGGYYFTKTKAVLNGRDPIFRKGQPFKVTNNSSGYSVMTLTFTIKESSIPQATGGKAITKTEFDQN